ncbi:LysR family transcriptional regulator [Croceicoccus sp. YJ47]|uniref:LysR family transcriptional regulator n=1 Tax=Croceicoccus sp. YJ47 TaxID=2798724 RepID=UPI001F278F52|nr:LysR family transcriptional regulator [Croceicoccus sp. YJ47]
MVAAIQANMRVQLRLITMPSTDTLFGMANNADRLRLDDLSVFLAVIDAGGFRAAAKRLRISASSVSEKIAQLEADVGAPLLNRTTRSVSPTETGEALAKRIAPLLEEIGLALSDASGDCGEVRGSLKLNVPGAVMVDILPALIAEFMTLHPKVRVEIMMESRLVDIVAAGCDAGIRYGEHLAQDMIAVPIGPRSQCLALAAAPSYLAGREMLREPDDILDHECIRMRFSNGTLVPWELERDGDVITIDPPARLIVDVEAMNSAITLARSGRGIIATFGNWLDPYLKSGELVPVLPDWWQWFDGPRLYFYRRFLPPPLRAFVDFVKERDPDRRA